MVSVMFGPSLCHYSQLCLPPWRPGCARFPCWCQNCGITTGHDEVTESSGHVPSPLYFGTIPTAIVQMGSMLSDATTDLVLPLRGHDLGVGAADLQAGVHAGLEVRLHNVAADGGAAAD